MHGHGHGEDLLEDSTNMFDNAQSQTAIYTMLFGLSAHSIFEGLAIGLQSDSAKLWILSVIVLIHKSMIALVVGIAALRSLEGLMKPAISMFIFSISSPIGIAVGAIVCAFSADSAGMDLSVAILQAISTGTFLFVVFMELLPQELQLREKNALTKLIFILIGFCVMAGLQALDALNDD
jgi:zinc transporter 1/2/3